MPRNEKDSEWIKCLRCGHKFGRIAKETPPGLSAPWLEIKCSSCGYLGLYEVALKGQKKRLNGLKSS